MQQRKDCRTDNPANALPIPVSPYHPKKKAANNPPRHPRPPRTRKQYLASINCSEITNTEKSAPNEGASSNPFERPRQIVGELHPKLERDLNYGGIRMLSVTRTFYEFRFRASAEETGERAKLMKELLSIIEGLEKDSVESLESAGKLGQKDEVSEDKGGVKDEKQ
ncbi:uncharacterized protein PAC_18210 [Phialocephala subalpina]|uniref:Uncharacterized protein n=1 Tax=Phialocephala subalpina TaxID=576137 RepID=A0A1L7XTE7_9HELO|nr:uncharacterized protein PAC_18210 [Phialocephala subalpina]